MKALFKQAAVLALVCVFPVRGFSETPAPSAAKTLIVPGESIGDIKLGAGLAKVEHERGKPDYSDAAMGGKETESWYLGARRGDKGRPFQRPDDIGLSAVRDMDAAGAKPVITQIQVSSPKFATAEGIAPGSTLDAIRAKFPGIQPDPAGGIAYWPLYGKVQFYKEARAGIAFVIRQSDSVCIQVEVMPPGVEAFFVWNYPMAALDYVIDDINGTVGGIQLGMTGAKLTALLGKPAETRDVNTVAGGALWRWRIPAQRSPGLPALCIYLRKLPDGTLVADQIRVASGAFALTDQIFPGCPLKDIWQASGNIAKLDSYNDQRVDIYGDLRAGLLFDIRQTDSVCTAITIFPPLMGVHPDMSARWLDLPPVTGD